MTKSQPEFVIHPQNPFFVFDSSGVWHATVLNFCIWDAKGEYVGFVRGSNHDVYTVEGHWIGQLTADGRIMRRRVYEQQQPVQGVRKLHPPRPRNLPPNPPRPPSTAKLDYHFVDVLEWDPDVFKSLRDAHT